MMTTHRYGRPGLCLAVGLLFGLTCHIARADDEPRTWDFCGGKVSEATVMDDGTVTFRSPAIVVDNGRLWVSLCNLTESPHVCKAHLASLYAAAVSGHDVIFRTHFNKDDYGKTCTTLTTSPHIAYVKLKGHGF